jgi:hypothetical protein
MTLFNWAEFQRLLAWPSYWVSLAQGGSPAVKQGRQGLPGARWCSVDSDEGRLRGRWGIVARAPRQRGEAIWGQQGGQDIPEVGFLRRRARAEENHRQ